jgi:hypothetical protein
VPQGVQQHPGPPMPRQRVSPITCGQASCRRECRANVHDMFYEQGADRFGHGGLGRSAGGAGGGSVRGGGAGRDPDVDHPGDAAGGAAGAAARCRLLPADRYRLTRRAADPALKDKLLRQADKRRKAAVQRQAVQEDWHELRVGLAMTAAAYEVSEADRRADELSEAAGAAGGGRADRSQPGRGRGGGAGVIRCGWSSGSRWRTRPWRS